MRRSLALACVPLLLGLAPAQQALPVRHVIGNACGFVVAPPKTLKEWRERADLVVHVRILSQVSFEHETHGDFPNLMTAHEADVLTVIKADPRAVVEGAVQQVIQRGGRTMRPDHILLETWNSFDIMPIGSEWLLFLEWSAALDGFTLFYREHGAVEVNAGKVAAPAIDSYHREWNGRPAEEFLRAIREGR